MIIRLLGILCVTLLLGLAGAWAEEAVYICPMHPQIHGKAGDTCPICGMNLVPLGQDQSGRQKMPGVVALTPEMVQMIGVRIAPVVKRAFGNQVRAVGSIVPNERTEYKITSRAAGWIERLAISAVGDRVTKDQELYRIHSPDLLIAQTDYLIGLKRGEPLGKETHYKLFDHYQVDKRVEEQLKATKKPVLAVPYYAARDGVVSALNVKEGSYVTLDMVLAVLQDYSMVWVNVSVPEKDLPFVTQESAVEVRLSSHPGHYFPATVDYIYPAIEPETRTGTIRLVVKNPDGFLKVGGYADVTLVGAAAERIAVPSEAVLRDSVGDHVIIALGEGMFAPRAVKTGVSSKGMTEILEGVKEGEQVVLSGQFLIDSESNLRESLNKLSTEGGHAH